MNADRQSGGELRLIDFFSTLFRVWRKETVRQIFSMRGIVFSMLRASGKRKRIMRRKQLLIPAAVAISPTSECNLECIGCYSRNHPLDETVPVSRVESFIGEAVEDGVVLFVITGGEPFMLEKMLDIYKKNSRALFVVITNGTLIDEKTADTLSEIRNVIPVVSIEGNRTLTDSRRGDGVYASVMNAMRLFQERKLLFGFSCVLTGKTAEFLGSEEFIDTMCAAGPTLGIFNEFVPLRPGEEKLHPGDTQLRQFREQLAVFRRTKPMVLLYLPDDEYDRNGRCMAVGRGAMHINSRGWAEPCPFSHFARENITTHSFREILASPFFRAIREHPTALNHSGVGCALAGNKNIMQKIAEATEAHPTSTINAE